MQEPFKALSHHDTSISYKIERDSSNSSEHIVSCTKNGNVVKRRVSSLQLLASANTTASEPRGLCTPDTTTDLRERLDLLRKSDATLQDQVMELLLEMAEVRSRIVETEEALVIAHTPILSLPQEVLEIIFISTISDEGTQWPNVDKMPAVSQVCTTWRAVATKLRGLWNRFTYKINRPPPDPRNYELFGPMAFPRRGLWTESQQVAHLNLWFTRSDPLPVSFCIQAPDLFSPNNEVWKKVFHKVLAEQTSRIQVLRIDVANTPMITALTSGIVPLTSLNRLELALNSCHPAEALSAFKDLPALTSINYALRSSNPFAFPVRWRGLTDIDMGDCPSGMTVTVWKYLMRCCTGLERGRFFIAALPLSSLSTSDLVPADVRALVRMDERYTLPRLHTLNLIFEDRTSLSALLSNLELPLLTTLGIQSLMNPSRLTMVSWWDAFESRPSLRSLTISCGIIADLDVLKQCLECLPALELLKIKMQNERKLFDMLSADQFLPRLRRLSLWIWRVSDEERKAFWEVVKQRQQRRQRDGFATPFIVDAYVDKTKLFAEQVPQILEESKEYQDLFPFVRYHISSPYAVM